MKITVLITTYNRPQYLKRCLDSIKRSDLKGAEVIILDDASTNKETKELIRQSGYRNVWNEQNLGICKTLWYGAEYCFETKKVYIVINLDSDAIVRNDWMEVLLNLHAEFPNKIITGFHSTTKNADGSERHKIIARGRTDGKNEWCEKLSVGGINMLFTKDTFEKYAKPALEKCIAKGGNWDHQTCINAGSVICAVPSVIQHIGIESSLGHTHDKPDVADDFVPLHLPNVTLVCVDDNLKRCKAAIYASIKEVWFGRMELIKPIPELGSKEAYSKFILTELYKYIKTDYALIVQHDGYVKNPEAWDNDFLNYDYIGATWWYKDGMNVGNGGFSLRSKKLLQATAALPLKIFHPEDHVICRTYRKELEKQGIKFAPEELANKFSWEGWNKPGSYNGQFGFHGLNAFRAKPDPKKEGFIINQFLGLGDILFLVPLIRKWMQQGHDVIWPIADEYFSLKEYFKDIQFVKKSDFPMNYDCRTEYMHRWRYGVYRVKNLRWNRAVKMQDAMTTKYTMYGEDWHLWRQLSWERNYDKEKKLADRLCAKGEYRLVCEEYGNITDGGSTRRRLCPDLNTPIGRIDLVRMEGFCLLDWSTIIENATEIHAVSSSTLYLFEVLNLKCKEINLYSRKLGQRDFDYVQPLLTKNYKFHL